MTDLTEQDITRLAAGIRTAGELLEAHGTRALIALDSWTTGPRSANLDPTARGWTHETVDFPEGETVVQVPSDPTGETVVDEHALADFHTEYLELLERVDADCYRLRVLLKLAVPQATSASPAKPETHAELILAGWCISCHRDNRYCEPVAMNPDGTRRHRAFCLWCARFMAERRRELEGALETVTGKEKKRIRAELKKPPEMPPLELVKAHHAGQRITQPMLERALARHAS